MTVIDPEEEPSGDVGLGLLAMIRDVLNPAVALGSVERANAALRAAGWDPDILAVSGTLAQAAAELGQAMRTIERDVEAQRKSTLVELGSQVMSAAPGIAQLVSAIDAWQPPPGAPADTGDVLVADLLQGLVLRSMMTRYPKVALLLAVAGCVTEELTPELRLTDGRLLRAVTTRSKIDLGALAQFVADPPAALVKHFVEDSGTRRTPAMITDLLTAAVTDPLQLAGVTVRHPVPADRTTTFTGLDAQSNLIGLTIPFTATETAIPGRVELLLGLTESTGGEGLALLLAVIGELSATVPMPRGSLTGELSVGSSPLLVSLRGIRPALPGGPAIPAVRVSLTYDSGEATPLLRLGSGDSSHLDVNRIGVTIGGVFGSDSAELTAKVTLTGVHVVVKPAEGDGFLSMALGDRTIDTTVDLGIAWSSLHGVSFSGAAGLSAEIPVNLQLGPLTIQSVWTAIRIAVDDQEPSIGAELALSLGFALGPFSASVARVGAAGKLVITDKPGNIGIGDLHIGFKPPSGIGLAIDSPAVRGGGFLLIDPDAGQYAGVFELTIVGTVSVKAIAIISTKLPDGQPGFALLILITAEGFTPIQLGLGFTLTGVGGLLALNRTIDVDVIRNGLRDGVLDSVLFVKDPVKNAPRIISTLSRVFPIATGRLVIGPLAEISWGTPPLVKIRLALMLEIPQPIRVVLLAQLRMVLPDEKAAIVVINVDAVGVLDFGKRELSLDASIHDSRLLKFALSGDLALRLSWGQQPAFLMSVGGFHPKFPQPPGLRPLKRLTLSLSDSANPKIRFEAYLALTSNSIQMGAKVSVYASAGGFGVDGGGSFDALIQWSPFSLDVSFEAWVRIFTPIGTLLGARLALQVTGPEPWHITGVAELTVLFVTVRVGVDLRIGNEVEAAPSETVDVAAEIWAEISRPGNWQAALPSTETPGATLADPNPDPGTPHQMLVVHPLALLVGRQRVAPLDQPISRIGARRPSAGTRSYALKVDAAGGVRVDPTNDLFAPAQFSDLPDDALLTGPSFTSMAAGATLSAAAATTHAATGIAGTDLAVDTLDLTSFDDDAVSAGTGAPLAAV